MNLKIANSSNLGAGTTLMKAAWSTCRLGIAGAVLISVAMNVLVLTGPFYMLQIYDRVLPAHSLPTLVAFSALALMLFIAYGFLDLIRTRLMARLGSVIDMKFADAAFDRSTMRSQPGDGAGYALRDLAVVRQFLSGPAAVGLLDIPWLPFYMALIFLLHPLIGWVATGSAVIFLVIAGLNEWTSRKPAQFAELQSRSEEQFVSDVRSNMDTVDGMGMAPNLRRHWNLAHARTIESTQGGSDRNASYAVVSRNLRLIMQSTILGLGAYLTMQMELSSGALIASSIIFARALAPVDQAVAHWRTILTARRCWKRLSALTLRGPDLSDRTELRPPSRSLAVSNIAVGTQGSRKLLLPNVSFRVEAGDCLGVIGASGAGKSSLLRALVGSSQTLSGEIRIDGATLDQWSEAARAKHIGYLAQDVQLLDGTIRQNISRFQKDVSSEAVIAAAEMAGVHDLILSLQDGYDTLVGANGFALSAGQKQRLGLARAVYGMPFLIVLDEPNAHLDRHGEDALAVVLHNLRAAGSIVIVAAHRSAILSEVNKMLLLENGQPGVFGSKEDVLAQLAANVRKQAERGLHVVGA
ncbi:type I secretion system permease/ATPase [Hyphomicrobium sp. B1]|uniref:type I secretion system permease/ATPase n=1 Tax=Hyphomicrobium sp. B1 TaxID=3075651 RepID=UPI003C2D7292